MAVILVTLPLLLPLAMVIGLIIRLVSTGPILFKQERVGYRGSRFMCLKFRTMYCGAETVTHQGHLQQLMDSNVPMTKMDAKGDSRIIPFGKLLRASGLDELPQLINVLKGEMSLVGPRPCLRLRSRQISALAIGAVQRRARPDRTLAGQWQKQDNIHQNDTVGYRICADQKPEARFENHFQDHPGAAGADVGYAPAEEKPAAGRQPPRRRCRCGVANR